MTGVELITLASMALDLGNKLMADGNREATDEELEAAGLGAHQSLDDLAALIAQKRAEQAGN